MVPLAVSLAIAGGLYVFAWIVGDCGRDETPGRRRSAFDDSSRR